MTINTYVIPNSTPEEWERFLALTPHFMSIFYNGGLPLSLEELKLLSKYPLPYHLSDHFLKKVTDRILEACNSESVVAEDKILLAKNLSLQIGITSLFRQLPLTEAEKAIIEEYFNTELNNFLFEPHQRLEDIVLLIQSTKDTLALQKLAFDFLGSHDLKLFYRKEMEFLYNKLTNLRELDESDIDSIQSTLIYLASEVVNKYKDRGFLSQIKHPSSVLTRMTTAFELSEIPLYGPEDTEIPISHGGGFYYLCNFFLGEVNGYRLENFAYSSSPTGLGIQVTPENAARRDLYYARRMSPAFLDQPCVLTATLRKNQLQKSLNGYEACLRTENKIFLRHIKLHNLVTGMIIEAEDYDQLIQLLKYEKTSSEYQTINSLKRSMLEQISLAKRAQGAGDYKNALKILGHCCLNYKKSIQKINHNDCPPQYVALRQKLLLELEGIYNEISGLIGELEQQVAAEEARLMAVRAVKAEAMRKITEGVLLVAREEEKPVPSRLLVVYSVPNEAKKRQERLTNQNLQIISGINRVLEDLKNKIATIDQHHSEEAYAESNNLLTKLTDLRNGYEQELKAGEPRSQAKEKFINQCKTAIQNARPVLEVDLHWGEYLTFVFERLVNSCMEKIGYSSIFDLPKSTSILALEDAETQLVTVDLNH